MLDIHISFTFRNLFFLLCVHLTKHPDMLRERYREMDFINMEIFSWNLDVTYERVWNIGTKDVG